MEELPVHTLIGDENRIGSLLLCGLNHGYSKEDARQDNTGVDRSDGHKSFFSDKEVNDYPFRNNIVKWFSLWGYKLIDDSTNAGTFEKSIVQTNWLQTCTNNMNDINKQQACIDDSNSFIETCQEIKPRLIFFFSQELLWAFNSDQLSTKVESIFGKKQGGVECKQKDVIYNGKHRRRLKFCFQSYENLHIVSMPHATGAQGVADDYIEAFKPEMRAIIEFWWQHHQKQITR
jgi:hypothetical protein